MSAPTAAEESSRRFRRKGGHPRYLRDKAVS